ncbi:MAG: translation initiation factor IF-2 subunit beta [Candidatus Aenigmatarchaeota archaeon]
MNYNEMLKKARESLPKKVDNAVRFEPKQPLIETHGKTTIVKNFSEIAKHIRREPKDIAKYLFKELGVPGAITGETLVLNGSIGREIIAKRLDSFIKEYVCCHECGKVDTQIEHEGRIVMIKCEACGAKKTMESF